MFSVLLTFVGATAPLEADYSRERRSGVGCHGNVPRSSGCQGQPPIEFTYQPPPVTVYVPPKQSANCAGGFGGDGARRFTPLRNIAANVVARHDERVDSRQQARSSRRGGETTSYHAVAAVPVTVASTYPVPQSAAPPHCPVPPGAAKP